MGTISNKTFKELVTARAWSLLQLSRYLSRDAASTTLLTRPLLGNLLSQSTQLEELLDAYGAQNNRQWFKFRAIVAAIKLFTNVSYLLLHIKHVLPSYHLLKIEHDFVAATNQTLAFTSDVLSSAAAELWDQESKPRVTPAKRDRRGERLALGDSEEPTPAERRAAMTWAQRLKRVFNIDIETCQACGGAVRIIASIEDPVVIEKILTHLAKKDPSVEPARLPPCRPPPQSGLFDCDVGQ